MERKTNYEFKRYVISGEAETESKFENYLKKKGGANG
jgi:hypothetical protein